MLCTTYFFAFGRVLVVTAILVVERDPGVCSFIVEALETNLAASVTWFNRAAAAIGVVDIDRFDLAIIDVGLPETSGLALARHAANKNIPTLLSSDHPETIAQLKQWSLPHLAKPFDLADLLFVSAQVIVNAKERLAQVKASLAMVMVADEALRATIAESKRLRAERAALLVGRKLP